MQCFQPGLPVFPGCTRRRSRFVVRPKVPEKWAHFEAANLGSDAARRIISILNLPRVKRIWRGRPGFKQIYGKSQRPGVARGGKSAGPAANNPHGSNITAVGEHRFGNCVNVRVPRTCINSAGNHCRIQHCRIRNCKVDLRL